jgi:hypothetical protein
MKRVNLISDTQEKVEAILSVTVTVTRNSLNTLSKTIEFLAAPHITNHPVLTNESSARECSSSKSRFAAR